MKNLLIVAHGSRREASNEEVRELTLRIKEKSSASFDNITCAFLELAQPSPRIYANLVQPSAVTIDDLERENWFNTWRYYYARQEGQYSWDIMTLRVAQYLLQPEYSGSGLHPFIDDILDGQLEVVAGSSHVDTLTKLQEFHSDLRWKNNEELESEELLNLVWEQVIDYTIADSNEIRLAQRFYPELRVAFDISEPQKLAWAFPYHEDKSLYKEAEKFFAELKKTGQVVSMGMLEAVKSNLGQYIGYLNNWATEKKFIGKGVGKILADRAIQILKSWGCEAVRINMAYLGEKKLIDIFAKVGFKPIITVLEKKFD